MIFRFRCPHCAGKLKLPADWRGRRVRCPKCNRPFQAPANPAVEDALPAAGDDIPTVEEVLPADEVLDVVEEVRPVARPRPRPQPKSTWQSVKSVLVWPLRVVGVLAVVGATVGWLQVWAVPNVAKSADVEIFDLLLRCVEHTTEHPIDPFYVLKGNDRINAGVARLTGTMQTVESIETVRKGPYEHVHRIHLRGKSTDTATTTSPHLTVPPEELRKARLAVEAMYPPSDTANWEALQDWAKSLWRLNWFRRNPAMDLPEKAIPEPRDGTEEERCWLVWQILSAGQPQAERDLPRLPALLREAYPNDAERAAALAWARTFRGRLRVNAADHHRYHTTGADVHGVYAVIQSHTTWVPPDNEVTMAWLLYQYVGLTPESRDAARTRWLSYFPARKAERALAYGKVLEAERRAAGESLPPTHESVALLCAVERFLGTDGHGERCRDAYRQRWPNRFRTQVAGFSQAIYPGDDFYFVVTSGDRLRLFTDDRAILFIIVPWILVINYGFRLVTLKVVGEGLLKLGGNPNYLKYRDGGGHRPGWAGVVLSYVVMPVVGWVLAMATTSQQMDLLIASPAHHFLGSYLAVLLGGTMIGVPARFIAVLLIKLGVNVEKTWLDEIFGITAGAFILRHFGNDWLAIAVFALFELLPTVVGRVKRMVTKPVTEE